MKSKLLILIALTATLLMGCKPVNVPDIKIMGDVIRWVASDINKEESDVLEKNGLTMKDTGKYTGARTKEIFTALMEKQ